MQDAIWKQDSVKDTLYCSTGVVKLVNTCVRHFLQRLSRVRISGDIGQERRHLAEEKGLPNLRDQVLPFYVDEAPVPGGRGVGSSLDGDKMHVRSARRCHQIRATPVCNCKQYVVLGCAFTREFPSIVSLDF